MNEQTIKTAYHAIHSNGAAQAMIGLVTIIALAIMIIKIIKLYEEQKKEREFEKAKEKLAKEKIANPMLHKAILEATDQSIIDFALKMWDNQATIDMAKVNERAGDNAFIDTKIAVQSGGDDFDSALNDIVAKKYK